MKAAALAEPVAHTMAANAGPLYLLVVQPTPFCNIDCDYCYLRNRTDKHVMSQSTLETLLRKVFASPYVPDKGFTLVWHAGEPLVLPVSYYRDALNILRQQNRRDLPVRFSFQTNGTLIDQEWCAFFKEANASVGVSLDGPRELHDRHRKTRNGKGTFDRVMKGIRLLQNNDVSLSVICVLTAESLTMPEAIYRFFVENGITKVGFNVEEMEGQKNPVSLTLNSCYQPFRDFFTAFMELNRDNTLSVREVGNFESMLRMNNTSSVSDQCRPLRILTVDWQGGMSTFSPELHGIDTPPYGPYVFGNVNTDEIEQMLSTPKYLAVHEDLVAGVVQCERECEYFSICGGGAPANKLFENGTFRSAETMYCRTRIKALTDVLIPYFETKCSIGNNNPLTL